MSLHYRRPLSELPVDERFALTDGAYHAGTFLMRVASVEGAMIEAVDQDGAPWTFALDPRGHGWRDRSSVVVHRTYTDGRSVRCHSPALWTDPLPRGTDAQAVAWVRACDDRNAEGPVLVHVTGSGDGNLTGTLVTQAEPPGDGNRMDLSHNVVVRDATDPEPSGDGHGPAWTYATRGAAVTWEPGLALPAGAHAPGDLVLARRCACEVVDGAPEFTLVDPVILGRFADVDEVAAFIPDHTGPGMAPWPCTAGPDTVQEAIDLAHARLEPDEALVVVDTHPDRDGDTVLHVLGTSGATFHMLDAVGDHLHGQLSEPGLWLLEGASTWASHDPRSGEHDCGIEGDWRPATPADLERFGVDTGEVADVLNRDLAPGELDDLFSSAERACAAERARRP